MSYANWNSITQYLIGNIVVENGEDYQALTNNIGKLPSGNPGDWSALAPPGPGPSNQLAFNQPTSALSIVGGNSVDISPALQYQSGSGTQILPADTNLLVGNTAQNIPYVSQLRWIDPSLVAPTSPNIPIYIETDPPAPSSPPAPYRWLEAHWFKQDPNPALQQDKYFWIETSDGTTTLGSQWLGVSQENINFDVQNISITTGTSGANSGILFKNGVLTGNLYQDALGDLYWNGTKLN